MTRREEAIEKAAQEVCHQILGPQPLANTNPMTADSFRQDARQIVNAYEAHMRPEVTSVEDAENLPNGTIVQDDMDLLLRVDGEWRVVEYQDSRAYPITPARVLHWGGSDA